MNRAVAVASRSFSKHPVLCAELCAGFPDARFNSGGTSLAGAELVDFLHGCHSAIIALERIDTDILDQLPELRVISKYGVGLDAIDLDALWSHGVALGWEPGVNALSVAELTVHSMIALLHRVPEASALVQNGQWHQLRGRQLTGRTVGIIGCGHVGKEVVRLLAPFACRILVSDIRRYDEFYREWEVEEVSLETLLMDADVVTLHVPLDRSTRNILSAGRLAMMKRRAVLINHARGGLVDEEAARVMIQEGKLLGAAFDTLNEEPPGNRCLLECDSVSITPHIGGSTEEAVLAMGRAAIRGLSEARPVDEYPELRESVKPGTVHPC